MQVDNLCRPQVVRWSPTPFVFSLVRQFLFLSRGSPIFSALFFKLIFKNNKFLYLYYISYAQTLLTRTSEMSLILNFQTEISNIEGNPQTLPQIRIDDVEAESCLNVTSIICPNNLRLIIICRLGTSCVRSKPISTTSSSIGTIRCVTDIPFDCKPFSLPDTGSPLQRWWRRHVDDRHVSCHASTGSTHFGFSPQYSAHFGNQNDCPLYHGSFVSQTAGRETGNSFRASFLSSAREFATWYKRLYK
jgi:hypothetical protein